MLGPSGQKEFNERAAAAAFCDRFEYVSPSWHRTTFLISFSRNQKEFPHLMSEALSALAKSGKLGEAEFVFLYSYRNRHGIADGGV